MTSKKQHGATRRNQAATDQTHDDEITDEVPQLACIDAPCQTPRHCMSVGERCLQGIDDGQLFDDLPKWHGG